MRFAFFTSLQRAYIRSCRTGRDAMHCVSTSVAMPWYVRIATCLIFVTAVETDNYPSLQKNPSRHCETTCWRSNPVKNNALLYFLDCFAGSQ